MEPAREELAAGIEKAVFADQMPVYQNYTAKAETNPASIKANLIAQLTAPVLWTQSVKNMIADGAISIHGSRPGQCTARTGEQNR
jgi:[acyl-carrier-protein] S-malonyltransferase